MLSKGSLKPGGNPPRRIDDGIRRILKDDVDDNGKEYPNAYCYNESTICDGAKIRSQMNSDPMTRRPWSTAFRQDLGCEYDRAQENEDFSVCTEGGSDGVGKVRGMVFKCWCNTSNRRASTHVHLRPHWHP